MAKTKAELESDYMRHSELMIQVRQARKEGDFLKAVELAVSAWEHVDGMMQYERRYGGHTDYKSIDSIEFVLRFAPLIFEFKGLEQLAVLLKSQRRIDKNTSADLVENLDTANTLMWDAHRLWRHMELHAPVRQDELRTQLGGDQDRWRWIAETWAEMGLIKRTPHGGSYLLTFFTRLDEKVRGKCPSCGATGSGVKARLLEDITCPKCQTSVHFVLILTQSVQA